jgi:hypothetical protein
VCVVNTTTLRINILHRFYQCYMSLKIEGNVQNHDTLQVGTQCVLFCLFGFVNWGDSDFDVSYKTCGCKYELKLCDKNS